MENIIKHLVEEKIVKHVSFQIETKDEAEKLSRNYEDTLESLCRENGIDPEKMLSKSKKNKLPFLNVSYKDIDGKETPVLSKAFYDVVTDSYTFTDESFLPLTIAVNLEDWSEMKIIEDNKSVISTPKRNRRTLDYYVLTFEIENMEQAREFSTNFDKYMLRETRYNPHFTGYEKKDANGNIIKPIMITCVEKFDQETKQVRDYFEKSYMNSHGNIVRTEEISLPCYISVDSYDWSKIQVTPMIMEDDY